MKLKILGLGVGGLICLQTNLASAQTTSVSSGTARFSGTVTYTAPNDATISITGELTLPTNNQFFDGGTVTYNSTGTANTDDFRPTGLTLTPADVANVPGSTSTSPSASQIVANELQEAFDNNDLSTAVTIIRAVGGLNGLD